MAGGEKIDKDQAIEDGDPRRSRLTRRDDRNRRQAEALRANLRRRKAQIQGRATKDPVADDEAT